jgi:hypothetical protein
MTYLEAKTILCSTKLNISYADVVSGANQLFTLDDINQAMLSGISRAVEYKPWPFVEGSTTFTADTSSDTYGNFIDGPLLLLIPDSAFLVTVDGVPWSGKAQGKRTFADYMKWRSDYPTDNSKIWSEYGGAFYINPNALVNGQTIVIYGLLPIPLPSNDDDILPFFLLSGTTNATADQAVTELAYANLLISEKKKNPTQAALVEKAAMAKLDGLWQSLSDRKALKNPQNRPFFNTGDYFSGRGNKPTIGNF